MRDMAIGSINVAGRLLISNDAAWAVLDLMSGEGQRHDLECSWCTRVPTTTRLWFVRWWDPGREPAPWHQRRLCRGCVKRGAEGIGGLYEFSEEVPDDA